MTEDQSTKETDKNEIPSEPKWVWLALSAGCFVTFLMGGFLKTVSMLYVEWLELYGEGPQNTGWVTMAIYICSSLPAPVTGYLADIYPVRYLLALGVILGCSSMLIGAFAPNLWVLVGGFGVFCGFAIGLTLVPYISLFNRIFFKRRGMANGLIAVASSTGTMLFPIMYSQVIEQYTVRGALMVLGGLWLNTFLLVLVLRPERVAYAKRKALEAAQVQKRLTSGSGNKMISKGLGRRESYIKRDSDIPVAFINNAAGKDLKDRTREAEVAGVKIEDSATAVVSKQNAANISAEDNASVQVLGEDTDAIQQTAASGPRGNVRQPEKEVKRKSVWTRYSEFCSKKLFWVLFTYYVLAQCAFYNNNTLTAAYLGELGLSKFDVATSLSILAVIELITRFIYGMLVDWHWSMKYLIPMIGYIIITTVFLVISFSTGTSVAFIHVALLGLFAGINHVVRGPVIIDVVGFENMGAAMGLLEATAGSAISATQVPFGTMREVFGTYVAPLRVVNSLYLVAAGLLSVIFVYRCSQGTRSSRVYTLNV